MHCFDDVLFSREAQAEKGVGFPWRGSLHPPQRYPLLLYTENAGMKSCVCLIFHLSGQQPITKGAAYVHHSLLYLSRYG